MHAGERIAEELPLLAFQGIVLCYLGIVVPSILLLSFGASFLLLGEVAIPSQWLGLALVAAGVLGFVNAAHAALPGERIPAPTSPLLTPSNPEANS